MNYSLVALTLILIASSFLGVSGFDDMGHLVLAPYGVFVVVTILAKKLQPLRVHAIWLMVCLAAWLQIYRLYRHELWSSEQLSRTLQEVRSDKVVGHSSGHPIRIEVFDRGSNPVLVIEDRVVLQHFAMALEKRQAEPAKFPRAWRLVVTSAVGKEEMDANADFIRTNEGTFKLRRSVDEILNLPKAGE